MLAVQREQQRSPRLLALNEPVLYESVENRRYTSVRGSSGQAGDLAPGQWTSGAGEDRENLAVESGTDRCIGSRHIHSYGYYITHMG